MIQRRPPHHHPAILGLFAAAAILAPHARAQANPPRTLTGTVMDRSHEPLKGAVVEVKDESTSAIISYITDDSGAFSFKRLSSNSDYRVTVTYHGHHAKPHELSHFDSKLNPTINFVINLF